MSSFAWDECCVANGCVDFSVDFVEGELERVADAVQSWNCGSQAWAKKSIVGSIEEEGGTEVEFGYAITKAVGQTFDQAVRAQAAKLVGECALG